MEPKSTLENRPERVAKSNWSIRPKIRSVQSKFLSYVIPLVLLSTISVFGFFELNARRLANEQLQTKLTELVNIQSLVVAESLWNVADEQIVLTLQALMTDADVVSAIVYDERDTVVAAVGDYELISEFPYFAQRPIVYSDVGDEFEIGRIEIALTDARLVALGTERITLASVLAVILVFGVVAAVIVANQRTIGRPLSLLLESINRAQTSGQRNVVEWQSEDEIGLVVSAYNGLQRREDIYEAELQASRNDLEQRVADRTADLARAEAEAVQAQKQLVDAISSVSDGFALFDKNDALVVANDRYNQIMLGKIETELPVGILFEQIVQNAADTGRFPNAGNIGDTRTEWVRRQLERHKNANEPYIQEIIGDRWQRISNQRTDEGGTVAIHSDISDIKRISDELKRAKEAAEKANEAKSTFLATMSHEIRTPLNGVIGMSSLLRGTQLDAEQEDICSTINMAAETLLTIINDILDFSKVEAGAVELEKVPVDLVATVENAVELVAQKAAEKGIELACNVKSDVPAIVYGDPVRLKQILLNLLNNAVKFTEKGEVVIDVTRTKHTDQLKSGGSSDLVFRVKDTGIGIPQDRMDLLFKSFSQVDTSTTRRYGGTGLGLVITKRLVELMGGKIDVESKTGEGTVFVLTLPFEIVETNKPPIPEKHAALVEGRTVLVVEDNRTSRMILNDKLLSWRFQSKSTASPEEALQWIKAGEQFDLCLIDYATPGMNGFKLAAAIQLELAENTPPLILLGSASTLDPELRSEFKRLNFTASLSKPVKSSHLFNALVGALSKDGEQNPKEEAPDAGFPPALEHLSILLVDDNMINRKVGAKMLARVGLTPDLVDSGTAAISACKSTEYDIVLMDIEMPEMDGMEAARLIREALPRHERPYIAALTANAMSSERETYLKAGMDDYLSKPIDFDALLGSLKNATIFRNDQKSFGHVNETVET